jgi:hypothetical protein
MGGGWSTCRTLPPGSHPLMTDDKKSTDTEGSEGEQDKDTLPAAPSKSDDTPLGDTDQHSKVPSPPAQTGR